MEEDDSSPRPAKRARRSCERCRHRKQRCHGFPICSNCQAAKESCKQPESAIEEYKRGPNQALVERILFLESQLAVYHSAAADAFPSDHCTDTQPTHSGDIESIQPTRPISAKEGVTPKGNIADIAGFLGPGSERVYVGPSSGFALASSLGRMIQVTAWNQSLMSIFNDSQSQDISPTKAKKTSAGPPDDDMGSRILDAYWTRTHHRYPFLDRSEIMEQHANRFQQRTASTSDQFSMFKLYMVYAIGSTMLKLTDPYDYIPPENFLVKALQCMSAARESYSLHNIQAMTLLVLYNLPSASTSGIWYMIGLAMRTCIDLGLHREAHYAKLLPYDGQLRRRLFWSVYFLERFIAVSLGRPYSISDRDIDAALPLEIDDTVRDDGLIARTLAVALSPTFQASRPSSNLTLSIQCIRLMRLESRIQTIIYRVDQPVTSLASKMSPILRQLEDWHSTLPSLPPSELDYLNMHYNKAIRLAIQPFLTNLPSTDPKVAMCLKASGQICQMFKRLHLRNSYSHSFIALRDVFIAGVTMCYCLFISPNLWTSTVSNDIRTCSLALIVSAERTPAVKKYGHALGAAIGATMEFVARNHFTKNISLQSLAPQTAQTESPYQTHPNSGDMAPPPRPSPSSRRKRKATSNRLSQSTMPNSQHVKFPAMSTSPHEPCQGMFQNSLGHTQPTRAFQTPQNQPQPQQLYGNFTVDCNPTYKQFAYDPHQSRIQGPSCIATGEGYGPMTSRMRDGVGGGGGGAGTQHVDAEWLTTLCEEDEFSWQMLNDFMKFDQS